MKHGDSIHFSVALGGGAGGGAGKNVYCPRLVNRACLSLAMAVPALSAGCVSAQLNELDPDISVAARIADYTIVSEDLCPGPPFGNCDAFRLAIAEPTRGLECPLIAVTFTDGSGHFRHTWPQALLAKDSRRWRLTATRVTRPFCHYAVTSASPEVQ